MHPILVPYHLDDHLPELDVPITPDATITRELPAGDTWERVGPLYDAVADAVADTAAQDSVPVVMSGDCTTSIGTVAGLQRAGSSPSIVWFDGHGDVQTLETSTSGYLGGFPLRILVGYRPELVSDRLGLTPIAEDRVVLVDARDLDPPEREYLDASAIRQLAVDEVAPELLPKGPIYLHLDFDVIDPDELPGLLFPTPDGPSIGAVAAGVAGVIATGRVAAVGLGCTWHSGQGAAERVSAVAAALNPG